MAFNNIKTLILDCDGLLVDSEPLQFEARRQVAAKFSHDLSEEDFLYFWFDGNGGAEAFCAKYALPLNEFQDYKHNLYNQFIDEKLQLCDGVGEFLKRARENYQIALCSNSGQPDIARILKKFDLHDYFNVIISGNDLKHGKPDPEGFLLAAKKTCADPANALVFENSHIGLYAAKAAKMACIVVPDFYGSKFQFGAADVVLKRIDNSLDLLGL